MNFDEIGRREKLVERKVLHQHVVLVHCKPVESILATREMERTKRTDVGSLLQSSIGDERDGGVESLRMLENLEGEDCAAWSAMASEAEERSRTDRLASKLLLDGLQGFLHTEPEVDLLTRRSAGDVSIEFGDVLNFLDPTVDFALQFVEEGSVGEEGGIEGVDGGALIVGMSMSDRSGDGGMNRENNVGNFDVLLY